MKAAAATLALVAVATVLSPAEALKDEVRECDRNTCIVNQLGSEAVELKCGDAGLTVQGIKFANIGNPATFVGDVCDEDTTDTNPADFGFARPASCFATNAVAKIEAECKDQESCKFDISTLFTMGADGLSGGCAGVTIADQTVTILAECGQPFDPFQIAIALVIVLIGLGLGATIEVSMIKEIAREHKRGLLVGLLCQYGFMPLLAFFFASVMDVTNEVKLGYILVGSCPGGVTSNLYTYWAKGSVALSITMSAFSTFCALFMLPFLVFVYVENALGIESDDLAVPYVDIFQALLLAIIPALLGIAIRYKKPEWAPKVEMFGSGLGVVFILIALVIGVLDNPDLFNPSVFPASWVSAVFYQPVGCLLGYVTARLWKLPRPESRAVCLETGVQNFVLAIAIVSLSFDGCKARVVNSFPLIATFFYLVNSVWIVPFLRFLSRYDTDEDRERSAMHGQASSKVSN